MILRLSPRWWVAVLVLGNTCCLAVSDVIVDPEAQVTDEVPISLALDRQAALKSAEAELAQSKPGDATAGASKAAVCAACHGLDGNAADPQYPKIAGQHELYIAQQLAWFKTQVRVNPIMMPFAASLSGQDMRDLGAYFATQKSIPGLADESMIETEYSANKGRRIVDIGADIYRGGIPAAGVPACMACHGPAGAGNPGPSYPAIGGQHSGYTASRLALYKNTLPSDPALMNPDFAIMAAIAARLDQEQILAVSSYLEGLHTRTSTEIPMASTEP